MGDHVHAAAGCGEASVRLGFALALVALLAACTAQAPGGIEPASNNSPPPSIMGAWRASVAVRSGALATTRDRQFHYVFHAVRAVNRSANYDAAPVVPPAYGVWRPVAGAGTVFEAKSEFFTTAVSPQDQFQAGAGWLPPGRVVFTERITVAPDGRTFTSAIRYQVFDATGGVLEGGGDAIGRGTRIDF